MTETAASYKKPLAAAAGVGQTASTPAGEPYGGTTHGAVGWFEIATPDPAAARTFYGELFGWQFVDDAEDRYQQIATPASQDRPAVAAPGGSRVPAQSGGLMDTRGEMPPYATICIRVDDCAATTADAQRQGAQLVAGPLELGDGMRVAYLSDPQGTLICVGTPAAVEQFAPYGDRPGAVGWFEIGAYDVDAATAFYGELFGWSFERSPDPHSDYRLVTTGAGHPLRGGLGSRHAAGPDDGYAIFCVAVADVAASYATAQRLGGRVAVGPLHPEVGPPNAHLLDPAGNRFGIYQPR